ncbi:GNAT family N-acetyltransferase [Bradyrhizobium sp.]|uniref:GNAT family N-acetyltransferase n=1 Tax=Bradyrhizobium sp. TaxID=376 RepID=UPI003C31F0F9
MTMAAAIERRTAEAPARSKAGHIASIDVIDDLRRAEPIWRRLESRRQVSTPYQHFDLLSAWQRQVGEREQVRPFIVIAYDAEHTPLLLMPLALRCKYGVRIASFMGGKHTTFNMALWDREFAVHAGSADLDALVSKLRARFAADVLVLAQQPARWRDLANPFAALPHQPSVNDCPVLTMQPGAPPATLIASALRGRLKGKERKLQKLPGYRYRVADGDVEIEHLLDWFFRVKPQRMAEQKLPNVFAEPGVEDFIRDACMTAAAGGSRAVVIHALECDEEVIALFAGVADGDRFSMMFNTYTMSGHARYSPGLILMRHIVDHYAALGYRSLDLGVGADDYKRMFCKDSEPIFDSFVPLSARGRVAAASMSAAGRAKRLVKQNQTLLGVARRLRCALR